MEVFCYGLIQKYGQGDIEDTTVYATYAVGGLTLGYQWSEADLGTTTGAKQYDNNGYGITFAINDDLSIGYNHYESEQTNYKWRCYK